MADIGLIGCGNMGRGLCRNLLRHGRSVLAYDVSAQTRREVGELGAAVAGDVAELVARCDVIITCLPTLATVRQVLDGPNGLVATARAGSLIIETSSSEPDMAIAQGARANARGVQFVDAPMLRGALEAWNGTLHILIGGEADAVVRALPIVECVSEKVIQAGALGNAQAMKAMNNAVVMTTHAVLSEVFAIARHLEIDLALLLEMMQGSWAASRKLEELAPKLIADYHPRHAVMRTCEKDLGICAHLARQTPVMTPVLESARMTYRMACSLGADLEPPSRLADILGGRLVLKEMPGAGAVA